ncbi:MAG: hypothetical protein ACYDBL_12510 [Candidatus Acidiferrales bacterium]
MKFAKIVFWIAGTWGVLTLAPLYFMFDTIGRRVPPAITHPQYYYGFVGVAMVWQCVFFAIATDPARFRSIVALSVLEKLSFALTIVVLYIQRRVSLAESAGALPDGILAVLFVAAFFKIRPSTMQS